MQVVVATNNKNKFKEMKELLKDLHIKLIPLYKFSPSISLKEKGESFKENAIYKALKVSMITNSLVIGEDSGLMVDILGGEPGVRSKRFSRKKTDASNNKKLLKKLEGVPLNKRGASFVCYVAIAQKGRLLKLYKGKCRGKIWFGMKGKRGFGYDPLFWIPRFRKTFAELTLEEKNKMSHRARAFKKVKSFLKKWLML